MGKLTARCGADVVGAPNRALPVKAKVIKTKQVRADTTVVEVNVAHPTDSGLLVRAIKLMVTLVARSSSRQNRWFVPAFESVIATPCL